jgi:hypothetical protein
MRPPKPESQIGFAEDLSLALRHLLSAHTSRRCRHFSVSAARGWMWVTREGKRQSAYTSHAAELGTGLVQGDQRPRPPTVAVLRRYGRARPDGVGTAGGPLAEVHRSALQRHQDGDSAREGAVHLPRVGIPSRGGQPRQLLGRLPATHVWGVADRRLRAGMIRGCRFDRWQSGKCPTATSTSDTREAPLGSGGASPRRAASANAE